MLTSAECREGAEQKLAEVKLQTPSNHRRRRVILADVMARAEASARAAEAVG